MTTPQHHYDNADPSDYEPKECPDCENKDAQLENVRYRVDALIEALRSQAGWDCHKPDMIRYFDVRETVAKLMEIKGEVGV